MYMQVRKLGSHLIVPPSGTGFQVTAAGKRETGDSCASFGLKCFGPGVTPIISTNHSLDCSGLFFISLEGGQDMEASTWIVNEQ